MIQGPFPQKSMNIQAALAHSVSNSFLSDAKPSRESSVWQIFGSTGFGEHPS